MTTTTHEPILRDVQMHLLRPNAPGTGVVVSNEICTPSIKSAGFVRHIDIDVSGTPLVGKCVSGQSLGVIAPGLDERGKPHKVRLYSFASPTQGSDGAGKVISVTIKRVLDEHWDNHRLFTGVASNFLCDLQEGDEVIITGPAGKRFVLPAEVNAHDYIFVATGTGIAPFRGMLMELLESGCTSRITLMMGVPYASDLLYDEYFRRCADEHERFTYLTAISRERGESGAGRYVQDLFEAERERLASQLANERTLIYICGIAGMELGIFKRLATTLTGDTLEQYLRIEPEAMNKIDSWDRRMIHKQVAPTRRVMLEVYA